MPVRRVAAFEEPVRKLGDQRGFIDLFWKGVLLVEQKSIGRNLKNARTQALEYFPGLKDEELPRYILLSDFQTFELYDLDEGEEIKFPLHDLPKHVEKFGFILGVQKRTFRDQDPVNIEASERVGRLHDAMEEAGYTGHNLERFLVRIVFCLFADDTGIFEPRDIFLDLIQNRTREDGSDLGGWLQHLFEVLDTPDDKRAANLDDDLARFPYVNGDLFAEPLRIPSFDTRMRQSLLYACEFDWSGISPAIFGALFQSVMDRAERRAQGAHYTTELNIIKVIEPLFLTELRNEFERLKKHRGTRRESELRAFQKRLGELTFFDPACGCGNFLIIAYRELRFLEIEVLREIIDYERDDYGRFQGRLEAKELSVVDVDQFFGIEIGEFPARIAEAALWMMDHIMNSRLSLEFGQNFVRIPIRKSPHIVHGDALEEDWNHVLPGDQCDFVLGNPPFIGAKYQTDEQRQQVRRIADLGKSGGTLDYVAAWYIKAGDYLKRPGARIGYVSTNSITQGEQVAQLWPILFERCKLEIAFAHRTFAWGSDARGKAHVHVVIIGLCRENALPRKRLLYSYEDINADPDETSHKALSPYLFDASGLADPHIVVREVSRPINGLPRLISGSQPIDDGNYIFDQEQRTEFLRRELAAGKFLHPYVGSREFLRGGERWILALQNAMPHELKSLPETRDRMRAVREYRSRSKRKSTLAIADYPQNYNVEVIPNSPFLVIPKVSSERREYIPIGWLEPPTIPSDLVFVLTDASLSIFATLTSSMHMSWVRHIGGRLKSDYRYSIGLVYNTFPMPNASDKQLSDLEALAQTVLDIRARYPGSTLSDLYDPDLMPPDLRRAHRDIDRAVDRLYRRKGFGSDRERVEHLLAQYEGMTQPLTSKPRRKKRRKAK